MSRDIETVIGAYMQAIEFTEAEELQGADFSPVARDRIASDVLGFVGLCEREGRGSEWDDEGFGIDFWLSRNGHGAGFFDRGRQHDGEWLQEMARAYGSCDAYRGDDGLIYLA